MKESWIVRWENCARPFLAADPSYGPVAWTQYEDKALRFGTEAEAACMAALWSSQGLPVGATRHGRLRPSPPETPLTDEQMQALSIAKVTPDGSDLSRTVTADLEAASGAELEYLASWFGIYRTPAARFAALGFPVASFQIDGAAKSQAEWR